MHLMNMYADEFLFLDYLYQMLNLTLLTQSKACKYDNIKKEKINMNELVYLCFLSYDTHAKKHKNNNNLDKGNI